MHNHLRRTEIALRRAVLAHSCAVDILFSISNHEPMAFVIPCPDFFVLTIGIDGGLRFQESWNDSASRKSTSKCIHALQATMACQPRFWVAVISLNSTSPFGVHSLWISFLEAGKFQSIEYVFILDPLNESCRY